MAIRAQSAWSRTVFVTAILTVVVAANSLVAQTMMNGKEVRPYYGKVNMLNERDGRIVIDVEGGSRGNWTFGDNTVVLRGAERLPIHSVLDSSRVRVWVSRDGHVQRIEILGMRTGPVVSTMNGKEVREYEGSVNMLNIMDGRIVIHVGDGSTGNWRVGDYTVVMHGDLRLPLASVLASRRVEAWVSRDGGVQRINILEMK